jgi:16S rRNA (guanine966-N2)-methyltransferase
MRVIAGRLRGSVLRAPPGEAVRPTYDRVRESLFSIIEPVINGAAVLDMFAGSGSLGIESLSRGAVRATFIESSRNTFGTLRTNIERLGLTAESTLIRGDALEVVGQGAPGGPFDIVFVDPPYSTGLAARALEVLSASGSLADDATVVLERATSDASPESTGRLELGRSRRYGGTTVDFYRARAGDAGREEEL